MLAERQGREATLDKPKPQEDIVVVMSAGDMTYVEALILLHQGTERQGPGDEAFSQNILARLPELPKEGHIADLGCGTGAASLLLAAYFQRPVLAVDFCEDFLRELNAKAEHLGFQEVTTRQADFGALSPPDPPFALLWSEGAAYNLTFEGAMRAWRPLLGQGGVAVVSELSWFSESRPQRVINFWEEAYPQMASEATNRTYAQRSGFEVHFAERLPAVAWWANYYEPLQERLEAHAGSVSPVMQQVITETRQEMELFRQYSDHYGYTFYVLQAV